MKRVSIYSMSKGRTLYRYIISKADGDKRGGWYTQTASISSFCDRILNRWHDKHMDSVENIFSLDKTIDPYYTTVTNRHFESVWDFYDYIEYNHKDKTKKQLDKLISGWKY